MAQPKAYTIRPISALGTLVSFVPLLALFGVFYAALGHLLPASLIACGIFLSYRFFFVRLLILRDHRRGILRVRRGDFDGALASFQASEAYWSRHTNLDRLRALLLASAGPYSFQTLARYNQAYTLTRLTKGQEALAILEQLLTEDPDNGLALALRDSLLAGKTLAPDPLQPH